LRVNPIDFGFDNCQKRRLHSLPCEEESGVQKVKVAIFGTSKIFSPQGQSVAVFANREVGPL
jgi:hypothetical protein